MHRHLPLPAIDRADFHGHLEPVARTLAATVSRHGLHRVQVCGKAHRQANPFCAAVCARGAPRSRAAGRRGDAVARSSGLVSCRPTGGGRRVTSVATDFGGQGREGQGKRASGILPDTSSGCARTVSSVGKMPTARRQPPADRQSAIGLLAPARSAARACPSCCAGSMTPVSPLPSSGAADRETRARSCPWRGTFNCSSSAAPVSESPGRDFGCRLSRAKRSGPETQAAAGLVLAAARSLRRWAMLLKNS